MNAARRLCVGALLLCLICTISFLLIRIYNQPQQLKWPLKLRKRQELYEIRLDYTVGNTETQRFKIPESAVIPNGRPQIYLNDKDLENISDDAWLRPINPIVYLGFPQAIDLQDTVSRLTTQRPIAEHPLNGAIYHFVSIAKSVCYPGKMDSYNYDIVVIVKTSISAFERRQLFRETYGYFVNENAGRFTGLRIGLVFSMGMPRARPDRKFFRGTHEFNLLGKSGNGLEPEILKLTRRRLAKEINDHSDLVIGAFEDTYFNLTAKTHHSFLWASTFCQPSRPDFLFIDDDVPFSPQALEIMLASMPNFHRNNLFHGKLETKNVAVRFGSGDDQRWAVLKSEVPFPSYAPYLQGIYILAGFSQVERISLGMMFTKYFPIEDAWLGLVANRLNITPRNIHEFIERKNMIIEDRSAFEPVDDKIFSR